MRTITVSGEELMKVVKWGLVALAVAFAGIAGYLFVGGKSPIEWSKLAYTDAVAEASRTGKPLLIDFSSPY